MNERTALHDAAAADKGREELASSGPGVLVEGSTLHTVDELNAQTIRLAIEYGWRASDDSDLREIRRMLTCAGESVEVSRTGRVADLTYWHASATEEGLSEALGWVADDALDYLNDSVCPDGYALTFDDGLVLEELDDEDGSSSLAFLLLALVPVALVLLVVAPFLRTVGEVVA